MDLVVLSRVVEELEPLLRGLRIDQAYALPRYHLCLVLGARGAPRLWFSAEPEEPHLYLRTGGHDAPARPPAFAMAIRKLARGRRLTEIRTVGGDRVVRLGWGEGRGSLVFELVPRRATAFALDPQSRVIAVWNPRRGRPGVGDLWEPPARRQRLPIGEIDEDTRRALEAARDSATLPRELMRRVDGVTPLIAREAALRAQAGQDVETCLLDELQRADSEPAAARIYSPAPLADLTAPATHGSFILAPYALRQGDGLIETGFGSLHEAAAAYYATRARLRMIEATKRAVRQAIRARRARLSRARDRLERSTAEKGDSEALRRKGDLLLAHPRAEVRGGAAVVADVYTDGSPIEVKVDPALSLSRNADRYYRAARRADRKIVHDRARRAALDRQERVLDQIDSELEGIRGAADCAGLLEKARACGLPVKTEKARAPEAQRPKSPIPARGDAEIEAAITAPPAAAVRPGISVYRTDDGAEILVGRSAAANDRVTHEIANKDDWWLHAEGPGSHVLLRNPARSGEPPEAALGVAAALAAWFSKARGSSRVEVHWTQARHVRRPRSGPPGLALLDRHRSLRVAPRSPAELGLQEPSVPQ